MKQKIFFSSNNEQCAAFYYLPDNIEKLPVIIMAHGLSGVKEMGIEYYAESFCKAGFAVLLFDYRYLGESTGHPRNQCTPSIMQQDFKNAIDFVIKDDRVDANRIGLWGTSFSGGQIIEVAYQNRESVKCFFSQVPALSPKKLFVEYALANRLLFKLVINGAKIIEQLTNKPIYIPIAAPKNKISALGTDSYTWLTQQEKKTNFENSIRLNSLSEISNSDPVEQLAHLKEMPKIFLLAKQDSLVPYEKSYHWLIENGVNKNTIISYEGNHYDVYDIVSVQQHSLSIATNFYNKEL